MKITTYTAKQTVKKLLKEDPDRTLYLVTTDVKFGSERKIKNYAQNIYDNYGKLKKAIKASVLNAEIMDDYKRINKQLARFPMVHEFTCNIPYVGKVHCWMSITKITSKD